MADIVNADESSQLELGVREAQAGAAQPTCNEIVVRLNAWSASFERLAANPPASEEICYHLVWALCHDGVALVATAVANEVAENAIRSALTPAVAIYRQSPFARRLQDWPRGYPGDFQTIEYICRQANRAPKGTIGWYVEQMALSTPVAQQHRNKVARQAALLAELAIMNAKARVLVIACGSAPDVRQALPWLNASRIRVVLNDADPDALAFCRHELEVLGDRVMTMPGNALRSVRRFGNFGPFDLVLCGGLFDYLTDPQVVFLLRELRKLPGGTCDRRRLFFTNMATGNPYRIWMEYFANWSLIERSEGELRRLAADAGIDAPVALERDSTSLSHLATCTFS